MIILLLNSLSITTYGKEGEATNIIKIGIYETNPYYEIGANGEVSGYYHELLNLIQEKYPFQYEYVVGSFSENLTQLIEGNIDLMFGVSVTAERLKDILYNKCTIATEKFALFANDENLSSVNQMKKVRLGLIEDTLSIKIALNYFSSIEVEVEPVYVSTWPELEQLFNEGKIDVMPHNSNMAEEGYNKIYEFSGDQVYIAGNKNSKNLLDHMDTALIELSSQKINPIDELYKHYFGQENQGLNVKHMMSFGILLLMVLLSLIYLLVPILKRKRYKNKIRANIRNNNYLLQYQPIYNLADRSIVGFEGLLRLQDEGKKLIPPTEFLPEIEENNMLFEISLWILETAIKDYSNIKEYACVKGKAFYISINVSLKEIENKGFIDAAKKLLEESKLGPDKICLEIIERIKAKELDKVEKHLKFLKEAGFKIAIDDFGTEYSNLDRLLSLDTHVIKIDKSLVEDIHKDMMKNEIITFVSRIAEVKNKEIILEGIEKEAEVLTIKRLKKDLIYVQGYYYSKPLFKEEIKRLV